MPYINVNGIETIYPSYVLRKMFTIGRSLVRIPYIVNLKVTFSEIKCHIADQKTYLPYYLRATVDGTDKAYFIPYCLRILFNNCEFAHVRPFTYEYYFEDWYQMAHWKQYHLDYELNKELHQHCHHYLTRYERIDMLTRRYRIQYRSRPVYVNSHDMLNASVVMRSSVNRLLNGHGANITRVDWTIDSLFVHIQFAVPEYTTETFCAALLLELNLVNREYIVTSETVSKILTFSHMMGLMNAHRATLEFFGNDRCKRFNLDQLRIFALYTENIPEHVEELIKAMDIGWLKDLTLTPEWHHASSRMHTHILRAIHMGHLFPNRLHHHPLDPLWAPDNTHFGDPAIMSYCI